jgi:aminopeptidase
VSLSFEEKLKMYAKIIVAHGLNIQKDQVLGISGEIIHRDLAMAVAEEAYKKGAKYVSVNLSDPRLERIRILRSPAEHLHYLPGYTEAMIKEIVDENSARLYIDGTDDPETFVGLDPKTVSGMQQARRKAWKYYYDAGIGEAKVHWCIVAGATTSWAKNLFPDMSPAAAYNKLWDNIFKIARADMPDALERVAEHDRMLHVRTKKLNSLKVRTLHFTGKGTDLTVVLSEKARFAGGSSKSALGVNFEPNIPSEEVFTSPDCRLTSGYATVTRPILVNGTLVSGLRLEFDRGALVNFTCKKGQETFAEYLSGDLRSRWLGEVALVGIDSPVFQSGIVFEEILYDENAACHIAIGSGFKFCIDGNKSMTETELAAIGFNDANSHLDMMISDETTDVVATLADGSKITLIKKGEWQEF